MGWGGQSSVCVCGGGKAEGRKQGEGRERKLPCCEEQDFKEKGEDTRHNFRTHCCLPCNSILLLLFLKKLLMERFYLLSN